MREIKFKGWDKKKKRWIGDDPLDYLCVCEDVIVLVRYGSKVPGVLDPVSCRQLTNPEVENLEIVEYTGLKDKSGKEIFEGDILEEEKGYYFLVEWSTNYAKFELKWKTKAYQYPEWNRGVEMTIIGNMHENPELLNTKQEAK